LLFRKCFIKAFRCKKLDPSTTETPSNAFVIDVKGDTSQPASKQIHQREVQHPLTTPNSKLPNKEWASPEEDPDYEQDYSQSMYEENFPALPNPSQENPFFQQLESSF